MKLNVNGETKILNTGLKLKNLDEVVSELGHQANLVVVEFNGTIIPPEEWKHQPVKDWDTLEIVTIVGGGS